MTDTEKMAKFIKKNFVKFIKKKSLRNDVSTKHFNKEFEKWRAIRASVGGMFA